MEDLAAIRRIKLEQCVQLATFQTDATQVINDLPSPQVISVLPR